MSKARNLKDRVFALMKIIDPSRESIGSCKGFFLIWHSFDATFVPSLSPTILERYATTNMRARARSSNPNMMAKSDNDVDMGR